MTTDSLRERRERALGSHAELFYEKPLEIVRGEGVYLFDADGRRYLDLYNNVPGVGHANPAVVKAMADQQATLNTHSRYLHRGIVTFAERLADLNHEGIESVVFSCSGTEANEVAIQIARLISGKRGLVCTDSAFHGNSEVVDSMSYVGLSPPRTGEIRSFPFPERYRPLKEGVSDEELCNAYLERLEASIESLNADGHGFAALIICSIFANEGVPDLPTGFMHKATALVHSKGGLVIADEVQSGYGRTGRWWGYEATDFLPDIVVGGKPMGNGLPLGATAARKEYIDHFRSKKDYFSTCAATPLQAAVGMTVLDEVVRLDLLNNATDVGAKLLSELRQRVDRYDFIGEARGSGLFLSVEMVKDKSSKEPDRALALSLCDRFKEKGFLISYSGKFENVLKMRPPLVFTDSNADEFMAAFDECMHEVQA